MTDLVPAQQVVIPLTGQVIDLSTPTDQIADAIDRVKLIEADLRAAKRVLSDEVLRRMDHEGKWTVHAPGWKVVGQSPGGEEFDGDELARRLRKLVKAGRISQGAMTNAVAREIVWTAKKAGINALRKLGDDVRAEVDACASPTTKPRSLQVTPEGGPGCAAC